MPNQISCKKLSETRRKGDNVPCETWMIYPKEKGNLLQPIGLKSCQTENWLKHTASWCKASLKRWHLPSSMDIGRSMKNNKVTVLVVDFYADRGCWGDRQQREEIVINIASSLEVVPNSNQSSPPNVN
ncbi:hypothetical protein KC865_03305 [Candidatus Kaiserbacteria bacterium]|nr:hypothetical protein [Candidatus Kaiserbacteria bacterium]USN92492.1 MAG: hypothetical protein H6782_01600 [Candidatus Nomurabacteria bacterium]